MNKKLITILAVAVTLCLAVTLLSACGNTDFDFSEYINSGLKADLDDNDVSFTPITTTVANTPNLKAILADADKYTIINASKNVLFVSFNDGVNPTSRGVFNLLTDSYMVALSDANIVSKVSTEYFSIEKRGDTSSTYTFYFYDGSVVYTTPALKTNQQAQMSYTEKSITINKDGDMDKYRTFTILGLLDTNNENVADVEKFYKYNAEDETYVAADKIPDPFIETTIGSNVSNSSVNDGKEIGLDGYYFNVYSLNNNTIIQILDSSFALINTINLGNYEPIIVGDGYMLVLLRKEVPYTAKNYTYSIDESKYLLSYKSINILTGKEKDVKINYYPDDVIVDLEKDNKSYATLCSMYAIEKDKTLASASTGVIINSKGKILSEIENLKISSGTITYLSDTRYLVRSNSVYYIYDNNFNLVADLSNITINGASYVDYTTSLIKFSSNGLYGAINFDGIVKIAARYDIFDTAIDGIIPMHDSIIDCDVLVNATSGAITKLEKVDKTENGFRTYVNFTIKDFFYVKTELKYAVATEVTSAYYEMTAYKFNGEKIASFTEKYADTFSAQQLSNKGDYLIAYSNNPLEWDTTTNSWKASTYEQFALIIKINK